MNSGFPPLKTRPPELVFDESGLLKPNHLNPNITTTKGAHSLRPERRHSVSLEQSDKDKLKSFLSGAAEFTGAALILFMFWLLMLFGHAMGL